MDGVRCLDITLSFMGNETEQHQIDLYDAAQALTGFHRSLALTAHMILHDEIIVQGPSLRGAQVIALPAEEGSWRVKTALMVSLPVIYALGILPNNSPLGHLVFSAYDYVVSETLGFHVDYNKSLGELYESKRVKESTLKMPEQHRLDSLVEKCEKPIKDMHRPIVGKKTALNAKILGMPSGGKSLQIGPTFSISTFSYVNTTHAGTELFVIKGRISSYNTNTFKGRVYCSEEKRPISFELLDSARTRMAITFVVNSLVDNAHREVASDEGYIYCRVYKNTSTSGLVKSYAIKDVSKIPYPEMFFVKN